MWSKDYIIDPLSKFVYDFIMETPNFSWVKLEQFKFGSKGGLSGIDCLIKSSLTSIYLLFDFDSLFLASFSIVDLWIAVNWAKNEQ